MTISDLQDQIKQYKDQLLTLERGTQEYSEAVQKAAAAQSQLNTITEDVSASVAGLSGIFENVSGAVNGLFGGFSALTTLLNLVEADTSSLERVFINLQAAMALTQALTSLSSGFAALKAGLAAANIALKALNGTFLTSPLFIIVGVIAAVIAGFTALNAILDKNSERTKTLSKAQDDYKRSVDENNRELRKNLALEKERGATASELQQIERNTTQKNREKLQNLIDQYHAYKKLNKEQKEELENLKEKLRLLNVNEIDKSYKDFNDNLAKQVQLRRAKGQDEKEIDDFQKQEINKQIENEKKELEALQKTVNEYTEVAKNIEAGKYTPKKIRESLPENVLAEIGDNFLVADLQKIIEREQSVVDKRQEVIDAYKAQNNDINFNAEVRDAQTETDKKKKQEEDAKVAHQKAIENAEKQSEALNKIEENRIAYENKLLQEKHKYVEGEEQKRLNFIGGQAVKEMEIIEELKEKFKNSDTAVDQLATQELLYAAQDRLNAIYRESDELADKMESNYKKRIEDEKELANIQGELLRQSVLQSDQLAVRNEIEAEREKLLAQKKHSYYESQELEKLAHEEAQARRRLEIQQQEEDQARKLEEIEELQKKLENEKLDTEARIEMTNALLEAQTAAFEIEQTIYSKRKELTTAELDLEKKSKEAKKKLWSDQLKSYSELMSASSKLLGENTVAGKILAVASATISTYQGAANALSAVPFPFNLAAAATTVATGLSSVKSILSTSVPGATDTSSSAASTQSVSVPSFPELETPINETYTNITGADEDYLNALPQSVLVVEDFNEVNSRVSVSETSSVF